MFSSQGRNLHYLLRDNAHWPWRPEEEVGTSSLVEVLLLGSVESNSSELS